MNMYVRYRVYIVRYTYRKARQQWDAAQYILVYCTAEEEGILRGSGSGHSSRQSRAPHRAPGTFMATVRGGQWEARKI